MVNPASTDPPQVTQIPKEYRDLSEVFDKEKAQHLPPHRGSLDHAIDLEEGTKPTFGPIYNLSETELTVLKKYIDENLARGFIRPSTSPFGAPVLFAKKKDGTLRLCVDYRTLNRFTIKNRYPLPLTSEILDRTNGAMYFTKFDLPEAYYRLRIKQGDEPKTAFRTRYGHYEYLVMPFGLTNAPGSFQAFINSVLHEFLDTFCIAYMDDILIYSNTYEEHVQHVRQVLQRLQENELYIKLEKSQFHAQEISFLGYTISPAGISMEPDRIAVITEWPVPQSVNDIQVFLGFANFYRRFIDGYSRVALPITNLLKKNSKFEWTTIANVAFNDLKSRFTSGPILRHFDASLPIVLHTDASGFAISGILSQVHDNQLHPVAFWSRKLNPAECNYDIHDGELLAIVSAMKHWRHYMEGSKHPVRVLTDHKNLEVFMTTKSLNRRQARWAEILSGYDFVLCHIQGTKNPADGLSRRPDYSNGIELQQGTIVPLSAFRDLPAMNLESAAPQDSHSQSNSVPRAQSQLLALFQSSVDILPSLRDRILKSYSDDEFVQSLPMVPSTPWAWQNDLLLHDGLIYVAQNDSLRLQLLQQHHDSPLAGHFGIAKTVELLSRNYYFPGMQSYVKRYVSSCDVCSRGKAPRHQKHGELAPLPVPDGPWKGITCDFIVDLPPSNGYDSILVFVDRLTKMAHYTPCRKTASAPEFAMMFIENVVRLHGIPESLVSDRGSIFTSQFWKSLAKLLGVEPRLSTAFHPQTDGQTEHMNQTIEQYLRMYCNYQQDDWVKHLPIAEFAYNNAIQSSTHCSPFYANYGHHPQFDVNLRSSPTSVPANVPAAKQLAEQIHSLHDTLVENVKAAQNDQARYYDANHKRVEFNVGDKVWLHSTHIRTQRPSKKLDWKRLGPFPVLKRVGLQSYRLQLPHSMKVHPVFHVVFLEPYHENPFPGRVQPPPPPIVVDGEEEWEVEEVLDSKLIHKRLHYLVKWKGYDPSENSWQPASDLTNSPNLIQEFHLRYPQKPSPNSPRTTHPRRSRHLQSHS